MQLLFDIDRNRVHVRACGELRKRSAKWVVFYALLARLMDRARESRDAYLTVEILQRYRGWTRIKPLSARKEIARHLAELRAHGCEDVLVHHGKTMAWRLHSDVEVGQQPSAEAVATWLDAREVADHDAGWSTQLLALIDATTYLQKGRSAQAQAVAGEAYRALRGRSSPALSDWAALLLARAAQRTDAPLAVIDGLIVDFERPGNAVERAVSTRIAALKVMRDRFVESSRDREQLDQLVTQLEQRGDIAALAAVLNVRGLVRRRAREHATARRDHTDAAILFGIVGDLASLQGALFNLAVCRADESASRGEVPGDEVFTLLDASLRICADFGLGKDSAQAEVAGVRWSLQRRDIPRARSYLDAARALIETMDVVPRYDRACYARARAEFALEEGRAPEAQRHFEEALVVFEAIGAVAEVRAIRARLAGIDPSIAGPPKRLGH